ncbi:thioredoxin-like protein [Thozetella sp. PMI_491]|nr:thioredoxin-like protein [Thozetella sp. PMI_491]
MNLTMEETEPAPVLTLKKRIAALKIAQNAANYPTPKVRQPIFNPSKAKPPPPPLPKRTSNSPATTEYDSQFVSRGPEDRGSTANAAAPVKNSRNGPPPSLPPRRAQPAAEAAAPALPPRRPSAPAVRNSVVPFGRPSLPIQSPLSLSSLPGRRAQTEVEDAQGEAPARAPRPPRPNDLPRSATAPSAPPKLPTRPQSNQAYPAQAETPLPERRPGFGDDGSDSLLPPLPNRRQRQPEALTSPRSARQSNQPPGPVQLYADTFDSVVIRSGKPSFVDFYAPFCKYCKELDPVYEELAVKYQDQYITIAKIDSYTEKAIGDKYDVKGWPMLYFFDGAGSLPIKFEWQRNMEWFTIFLDEQLSTLPAHLTNQPSSLVVHLTAKTFDSAILYSGKPAFVDFYAPFCKYCRELSPIYKELAEKYQDRYITIAKIDSYTQKAIGERYEVQSWPTLYFFDGTGGPPVKFQGKRDMEWMSKFIEEQMKTLPAATHVAPPPVPMGSRPIS